MLTKLLLIGENKSMQTMFRILEMEMGKGQQTRKRQTNAGKHGPSAELLLK